MRQSRETNKEEEEKKEVSKGRCDQCNIPQYDVSHADVKLGITRRATYWRKRFITRRGPSVSQVIRSPRQPALTSLPGITAHAYDA